MRPWQPLNRLRGAGRETRRAAITPPAAAGPFPGGLWGRRRVSTGTTDVGVADSTGAQRGDAPDAPGSLSKSNESALLSPKQRN